MRETRKPGNYPCQTVVHALKFQDVIESNIMIKVIAIIKSTANNSSCDSFGDIRIHKPAITTKVTNMIKAATTSL